MARKLTVKMSRFCDFYALELNGTKAARLAGYKGDDATLAQIAYENLRKPEIRKRVDELLESRVLSESETLARISEHATSDMADFLDTGELQGINTINLKKAHEAGKLRLLKKVRVSRTLQGASLSIELYDAQAALDKLMRYRGMYKDSLDVTSGGEPIDIDAWKAARAERLKRAQKLSDE